MSPWSFDDPQGGRRALRMDDAEVTCRSSLLDDLAFAGMSALVLTGPGRVKSADGRVATSTRQTLRDPLLPFASPESRHRFPADS